MSLKKKGLKGDGSIEHIAGIDVYPPDWFNPFDDATGRLRLTDNTRAVHWFEKSWMPKEPVYSIRMKRLLRRVLGTDTVSRIGRLLKGKG